MARNGAARDPLQLLPQNCGAGVLVAVPEHDGGGQKVQRSVGHFHTVEVPAQPLAGLQPLHGGDVCGQQQCSRQIDQGQKPGMFAHRLAFFREGENEVEKQGRLQHSGSDVAPINRPIEIVQLAGVLEGIGNEGDEAENVEMRGTGSGPAAQQDVEADAEIDKRNQPQPVVERPLGGNKNDAGIEWNRLPEQGIFGFRPDAGAVELALQSRHGLYFLPID